MGFSAIINIIMAIPKLWQVYKEILAAVDSFNKKKIDKPHDEAAKKLSDAKTIEEIKDATRKLADNP